MQPVYLDYNATTPVAPEALEAMMPYLCEHFGNPVSGHAFGEQPEEAIYAAREQVAACVGACPDEIIFTSGGTESNNLALLGVMRALKRRNAHVVISMVEHPSIENVCRHLESEGHCGTRLPVDATGRVAPSDLRVALRPETALVSVMLANNEVGTLQPVKELAAIAHEHGALMHTDAAQAVGKAPVDVDELGVDLLSIAGQKMYAPKGVGALYVRRDTPLYPLMYGANQENGLRPGTQNVPYIVALGVACQLASARLDEYAGHMRAMRDRLYRALLDADLFPRLNGHPELRLPNTLSVGFAGLLAADLLLAMKGEVAASAGSACHTGSIEISSVLQAMGVPLDVAAGTLRLSTGRGTTEVDIDRAAAVIIQAVQSLRAQQLLR